MCAGMKKWDVRGFSRGSSEVGSADTHKVDAEVVEGDSLFGYASLLNNTGAANNYMEQNP
jgi:hypothetical protein